MGETIPGQCRDWRGRVRSWAVIKQQPVRGPAQKWAVATLSVVRQLVESYWARQRIEGGHEWMWGNCSDDIGGCYVWRLRIISTVLYNVQLAF